MVEEDTAGLRGRYIAVVVVVVVAAVVAVPAEGIDLAVVVAAVVVAHRPN